MDAATYGRVELVGKVGHRLLEGELVDGCGPHRRGERDRLAANEGTVDEAAVLGEHVPEGALGRRYCAEPAVGQQGKARGEVILLLGDDAREDALGRLIDVGRAAVEVAAQIGEQRRLDDVEEPAPERGRVGGSLELPSPRALARTSCMRSGTTRL